MSQDVGIDASVLAVVEHLQRQDRRRRRPGRHRRRAPEPRVALAGDAAAGAPRLVALEVDVAAGVAAGRCIRDAMDGGGGREQAHGLQESKEKS